MYKRDKHYNEKISTENLYKELEKKTGLSTGLKQNGAITVASTPERLQELLRQATAAQLFDVNVENVGKQRVKELYPVIEDKDILGGVYMPQEGKADPVGVTNVLAKAAKMEGVKIFEKTPVNKINQLEVIIRRLREDTVYIS